MNYDLIESFLAISTYQSFSKAADVLYTTQPTVSHRIVALENELGTKLISRKRGIHNISLTEEGIRFLPIAESWKELYQTTVQFNNQKKMPTVAIGSISSMNNYLLSGFFENLITEISDTDFYIATDKSLNLYRDIENRTLDIAFCLRNVELPHVCRKPFCTEESYYICSNTSKRNPIAEPINVHDLNPAYGVFMRWGPEIRDWYQRCFGMEQQRLIGTDNWLLVQRFITQRDCWSTLPASLVPYINREDIFLSRFKDPPPIRTFYRLIHDRNMIDPEFLADIDSRLYSHLEKSGCFTML